LYEAVMADEEKINNAGPEVLRARGTHTTHTVTLRYCSKMCSNVTND
jgi:hypothetical protein